MNEKTAIIKQRLAACGLTLAEDQFEQLRTYYEELARQNERMNLTAITAFDEVLEKHFADSLAPLYVKELDAELNKGDLKMLDVGTGAGFPGLPLAIAMPSAQVTLADSLNKRTAFLGDVANQMGLGNVCVINGRAEDLAKEGVYRESFDLAVSRAVADLAVLCEYCLPFVAVGGMFLAWKGPEPQEELERAEDAIETLGGAKPEVYTYVLPESGARRSLIAIKKTASTPKKYPRRAGIPAKRPLGAGRK